MQNSKIKMQNYNVKLKIILKFANFAFLIVIFHFAFLIFNLQTAYAQFPHYPIKELAGCRNAYECYLYCQIPKNTPACWSYGKYILDPNVLGETDVAISYPIPELGNCNSAQDCFLYCSQPQNQTNCTTFAKNKGLVKEEDSAEEAPPEVMTAAETELGCDNKETCMALCNQSANFEKCRNFAQKYNLKKEPPAGHDGPPPQVVAVAKTELGCEDKNSCMSLCDKPENRERCHQFAKKHNLMREEDKRYEEELDKMEEKKNEMMEDAKKEFGCNSFDSCASFCSQPQNTEKCKNLARRHNFSPPSPPGQPPMPPPGLTTREDQSIRGPGGCASEKECRVYCEKHPNECPGFGNRPPQNVSPPSQSPSNTPQESGALPPQKDQFPPKQITGETNTPEKPKDGDFLGPGGCRTEAECRVYCEKHPSECPGFPKNQGQTSTTFQNLPQQSQHQPPLNQTPNQPSNPARGSPQPPPPQN